MPRASAPEGVLETLKACVFELVEDHKRPPTLLEVQEVWDKKRPDEKLSLGAIQYWLEILVTRGELKRLNTQKRKYAPISFHG